MQKYVMMVKSANYSFKLIILCYFCGYENCLNNYDMKKKFHLFGAVLALLLPLQQLAADELKPTVDKVTVYRIENVANGKFLSNGDNVENDARIVFADGN